MELDGSLRGPEGGPTKHRQAKVDRGGVEGVDGVVQVEAEVLIGVERAGPGDQVLGEVLVDVLASIPNGQQKCDQFAVRRSEV